MAITLLVTDPDLTVVGDPIYCWDSVDCTLRHNAAGSGVFTAPAYDWIWEQLLPKHRVVVIRDGDVFMGGPWERRKREQSDDGDNSGVGRITVEFADDLSLLVARNVYPQPANTPETQTADYWEYSGNAEQVLLNLANVCGGPGAQTVRRIPKLTIAGPTGAGSVVSGKLRLDQAGDAFRSIAFAGGGLGFRTRHDMTTNTLVFEVFAPRDLSNQVRFSFGLGNLRYLSYEEEVPRSTTAIVGGQGEGSDRALIARTNTGAETVWGRRETAVSRPGSDPLADLQQAGDEQLGQDAPSARLQTSAWDTPDQMYGTHYRLGDRVSVEVAPGEQVTDLVRLVHLQAWSTAGELLSAMVGTQDASTDPQWVHQLRQVTRRVSRLERTAVSAAPTV